MRDAGAWRKRHAASASAHAAPSRQSVAACRAATLIKEPPARDAGGGRVSGPPTVVPPAVPSTALPVTLYAAPRAALLAALSTTLRAAPRAVLPAVLGAAAAACVTLGAEATAALGTKGVGAGSGGVARRST